MSGRRREAPAVDAEAGRAIAVVGSLNRDHVFRVPHIAHPGETVVARSTASRRGGKGANQAVAAARLGATVALIGRVGADAEGTAYLRALVAEGVDVDGVGVDIDAPTGEALIAVADDAESAIVVVPGANGALTAADVSRSDAILASSPVTLLQLEVPLEAVSAAARLAAGTVVLDPAPARPLGPRLLSLVDVIVPNRGELSTLTGVDGIEDAEAAVAGARRLAGQGPAVVVTLGADGAVVVDGDATSTIPAPVVEAVDATGAGDAFCGALAVALAGGASLVEAVRWAAGAGAVATTRLGAQSGLPTLAEIGPSPG